MSKSHRMTKRVSKCSKSSNCRKGRKGSKLSTRKRVGGGMFDSLKKHVANGAKVADAHYQKAVVSSQPAAAKMHANATKGFASMKTGFSGMGNSMKTGFSKMGNSGLATSMKTGVSGMGNSMKTGVSKMGNSGMATSMKTGVSGMGNRFSNMKTSMFASKPPTL